MKSRNYLIALAAVITLGFTACNGGSASGNSKIGNSADSVSYALGHSIGSNLKAQFPDINPQVIASALIEAFDGKENKLFKNNQEADTFIRSYMKQAAEKKALENKAKGEAFLAANAKKSGVQTTASGLQYEVIKATEGPKPTAESVVKVHYKGTTIDGEVFDSSIEKGEPAQFPLNGVIKGWTEGLQLMSVGSKYKLYVPSDLAYGARQAGAKIGANSTLIFEIELLEIVKTEPSK
jgi:FKBP-type peptidyl-prolyl cis-trans isomerase